MKSTFWHTISHLHCVWKAVGANKSIYCTILFEDNKKSVHYLLRLHNLVWSLSLDIDISYRFNWSLVSYLLIHFLLQWNISSHVINSKNNKTSIIETSSKDTLKMIFTSYSIVMGDGWKVQVSCVNVFYLHIPHYFNSNITECYLIVNLHDLILIIQVECVDLIQLDVQSQSLVITS